MYLRNRPIIILFYKLFIRYKKDSVKTIQYNIYYESKETNNAIEYRMMRWLPGGYKTRSDWFISCDASPLESSGGPSAR